MKAGFKRVPAIDRCFSILGLCARTESPVGISEISRSLHINKSTVYNAIYTLVDLGILESARQNKFRFGTALYLLGREAGRRSELIQIVHPYLEEINRKTKLSAFLGIRSGMRAVILDKVDSAFDIKISSEVGMRIPLLAGAGGKALLSQIPDREIEKLLSSGRFTRFTPRTCIHKEKYKRMVRGVREAGVAFDRGEYIEGVCAFAVPICTGRENLQAALWAVGLQRQVPEAVVPKHASLLRRIAADIETRLHGGASGASQTG
jgi:IclR family KDG regulon transcriptional repressor